MHSYNAPNYRLEPVQLIEIYLKKINTPILVLGIETKGHRNKLIYLMWITCRIHIPSPVSNFIFERIGYQILYLDI